MFRISALLALVALLVSAPSRMDAQTAAAAGRAPAASVAGDEAAIRSLEDQERTGVLRQDFAALERIWSEHSAAG